MAINGLITQSQKFVERHLSHRFTGAGLLKVTALQEILWPLQFRMGQIEIDQGSGAPQVGDALKDLLAGQQIIRIDCLNDGVPGSF